MAQAALIAQAASAVAGGISSYAQGRAEQERANINAYIGETRAMQTATTNMERLNSEMATLRSTLATNQQGLNAGTMPFFNELRRVRMRENRIAVGNERSRAEDARMDARAARGRAFGGLISGVSGGAQSVFDLWQLRSRNG